MFYRTKMNYWDLLPDDIRFKIVLELLWVDSRELFLESLKKDKLELYLTLDKIFHESYDKEKLHRYSNLFIKNGINSKEKLKSKSRDELQNMGVKWGSIIKIIYAL